MDKVTNQLQITIPQNGVVDEGDGVVSFPNGLTITDDSVQRNGTRYEMATLDIGRYGNQLTGDHVDQLGNLIGETIGVIKLDSKVVVSKIRYAINENPYARLAYNLLVGGFSKNFSTETIGPMPDPDTGIYRNAELVGLSQVVTQNNYNAHINKVVHNSLEQSKQDGLDVSGIEEKFLNAVEEEKKMEEKETKTAETTKVEEVKTQTPVAEVKVAEKVAEVETPKVPETQPVQDTKVAEVPEGQSTRVEAPVVETKNETEEVKTPEVKKTEEVVTPEVKETNNKEDKMDDKKTVETPTAAEVQANAIAEAVKNALAPVMTELAAVRTEQKNAFDKSAKEPEFKKEEVAKNDYKSMDVDELYNKQINAAWDATKLNSVKAWEDLREINAVNLDRLKEKGYAKNSIGLDDLGNFVISPELYGEIVGHRNDYSAILNATEWKETLSLEFAWLYRTGDIDMKSVALNATDSLPNGNLKPMSEYSAVPKTSRLEELAAVTVVATSATRFAAVDLLSDAAQGYRTDYDRKRAQLVIAKLEGAVDFTGKSLVYNPAQNVDALTAWITAITSISDTTLNGTLIFNARTWAELQSRALSAGANGPLSSIVQTGGLPGSNIFGHPFIVVPNDLMPTLGGSENVVFNVGGVDVAINHAVFFADLNTFTGRMSGGLQYDVSNSAAYEEGGVVKSAYQRNELVLRGSFFRGGAVKDPKVVSGIRQGNTANVS